MERSLKNIKLPNSGYEAKIVSFLTHGEAKRVNLARFEGGTIEYVGAEVLMKDIPMDAQQKEDDMLLSVGVKELKDKAGGTVELKEGVFDELPSPDIRLLITELTIVRAGMGKKK